MKFKIPENSGSIIKVIGVGGGGGNAVNHMFKQGIVGVDFAVCNTDMQVLEVSPVPVKIQLGPSLTEGRGAGSKPIIGKEACVESIEEVTKYFETGTKMLFITAGMGGGTGTGAAPVVAKAAREMDILTIAIVTMPFGFEGPQRLNHAKEGLAELKRNVDTIIVISNDKLRQMYGGLTMTQAFSQADNVLTTAARGIAEIITVPGYVNTDFEDVNTVMRGSGIAVMGTAVMEGPDRAVRAAEAALLSPLLEDNNIRGAKNILVNISSGKTEATLDEVFEITGFIQDKAGEANLIWGNTFDEALGDKLSVTIIATGFEDGQQERVQKQKEQVQATQQAKQVQQPQPVYKEPVVRVNLDDDKFSNKEEHVINAYEETENAVTIEFDGPALKPHDTTHYRPMMEKTTPFVNNVAEKEVRKPEASLNPDRKKRLQDLSLKFDNPETLYELENEPAYMRRKVKLEDVPPADEPFLSNWGVENDDDNTPKFKENNSFLHDNVD